MRHTNIMQGNTKKPLCRFINNCRQFKNNQCTYRHDRCKQGLQCQRGDQCMFYHPERAQKSFVKTEQSKVSPFPRERERSQVDRKNIPCRNGPACEKYKQGQCSFNHNVDQKPQTVSKGPIDMECKFGPNCNFLKQGTCRFKHGNGKDIGKENTRNFENFGAYQKQTPSIQPAVDYSAQFREFEQSKVCRDFMMDQCSNSNCTMLHQLTVDNTLKRLYSRYFQESMNVGSQTLCAILKIAGSRVFAISKGSSVGFYELDEQYKVMKSVSALCLKLDAEIVYMASSLNYQTKEEYLIMATSSKKIYVFNPTMGSIAHANIVNLDISCTAVCFGPENIIVVGCSNGLHAIKNGLVDKNISDKIFQTCPTARGTRVNIVRTFLILGEYFMIAGTNDGDMMLLNRNFECKTLKIPNSSIKDILATTIASKPFVLVLVETTSAGQNQLKYQILSVNLLDFSIEPTLTWSDVNVKLTKIAIVYDKLFVCFNGTGVIVFNLPDLRKITGRIQSQGRVVQMEGDQDGNLLIVEEINAQRNNISVFKVKK